MNTLENFSPNTIEKKKKEKKRKVLRAYITAAAIAFGGIVGYGVNKNEGIDHNEKDVVSANVDVEEMSPDALNLYFGNDIEDLSKVNHAANIILIEMNKDNLDKVSLNSGTNVLSGSGRLDVARDFLTKHLNSKVGSKYPFKNKIISSGVYKREDLADILSATTK